jgi:hypothetical protein
MKSLSRILIILILTALVAGCGVRLAYNNMDWLIMRWIDRQVTLEPEQDLAFRQALEHRLEWHCASELPDYVQFLRALEDDIHRNDISVDRLMIHGEQLRDLGERLMVGLQPAVIELMASLNDEQIAEILEGIDERNEKLREQAFETSPEQLRKDRVDSMNRTLRRVFGRVNHHQNQRLHQWAVELEPTEELALSQRLAWRERLARAFSYRDDPETFNTLMSALLEPANDWSDEYQARMEFNRERTLEAMVDIHYMANDQQLRQVRSRLNSLANSFNRLSCA